MLTALALLAAISNPLKDPNVFPIAVWLQEPSQARRYQAAGFNLYVGLWQGPTEEQLAALAEAGMPVVCEQNATGLKHAKDATIVAWMHQDEPDNAQPIKDPQTGKDSWGPCVPPPRIVSDYRRMQNADPTRPVMLNLGQGVANDKWYGRGNGAKLEDYRTYVQGADIVSFDVYPVAGLGSATEIPLIAKGISRLKSWAGTRSIWNCLECTAISGKTKPTPDQVAAEAWSAIIAGSRGLVYFVHQFAPKFDEHALLDDPAMLAKVTALNKQIESLAQVINLGKDSPVTVEGPVMATAKLYRGELYVFAASLQSELVTARIEVPATDGGVLLEKVGGETTVRLDKGELVLAFQPYQTMIFKLRLPQARS